MLSLLRVVPGVVIGAVVYQWLNAVTGYRMRLTIARAALVLFLNILMATAAGGLTVRRA